MRRVKIIKAVYCHEKETLVSLPQCNDCLQFEGVSLNDAVVICRNNEEKST